MSRVRICVAWPYPSTQVAQKKQAFFSRTFPFFISASLLRNMHAKANLRRHAWKAACGVALSCLCVCVCVWIFVLCWRRGVVEVAPKQNISDPSYPPGWVVCSSSSALFSWQLHSVRASSSTRHGKEGKRDEAIWHGWIKGGRLNVPRKERGHKKSSPAQGKAADLVLTTSPICNLHIHTCSSSTLLLDEI